MGKTELCESFCLVVRGHSRYVYLTPLEWFPWESELSTIWLRENTYGPFMWNCFLIREVLSVVVNQMSVRLLVLLLIDQIAIFSISFGCYEVSCLVKYFRPAWFVSVIWNHFRSLLVSLFLFSWGKHNDEENSLVFCVIFDTMNFHICFPGEVCPGIWSIHLFYQIDHIILWYLYNELHLPRFRGTITTLFFVLL